MSLRKLAVIFALATRPHLIAAQAGAAVATADTLQVRAVLEFLKAGNRPGATADRFKLPLVGHWRSAELLRRLGREGVRFADVNAKHSAWMAPPAQIQKELGARKGRSFSALAYLAFIYSIPYPQYSRLRVTRDGNGLRVSVGDIHVLRFDEEDGAWRLTAVRLIERQGE